MPPTKKPVPTRLPMPPLDLEDGVLDWLAARLRAFRTAGAEKTPPDPPTGW
jgi:hypothetical protein